MNTQARAEFWKDFICTRCNFPEPTALRAQFAHAELFDFCECGCSSFRVRVSPTASVAPLAETGGRGVIFEADFRFKHDREKTLEILLFADELGNLSYVEVDCCANSYPIPDSVEVEEPPFNVVLSRMATRQSRARHDNTDGY